MQIPFPYLHMNTITVERKVLEKNEAVAQQNRILFESRQCFVINVVSSPGAGKTSILERTFELLGKKIRLGVIEGDVQTDLDARRVARYDVPVVQIITHGACHLDAALVRDALDHLDGNLDVIIIENVGNLVCPANYDLGENLKVVLLSTTEGDDKPLKYPAMFRNASVLVINKIDLLPHVQCDLQRMKENALNINPSLRVFETSATTGEGIPSWCAWLERKTLERKAVPSP